MSKFNEHVLVRNFLIYCDVFTFLEGQFNFYLAKQGLGQESALAVAVSNHVCENMVANSVSDQMSP